MGKCNSKQITQNAIDKYILKRGNEVVRSTVNKDIRNLKAFINWCRENRYVNGEIKIRELKEDERPVISLSNTQIKKLLEHSSPDLTNKVYTNVDPVLRHAVDQIVTKIDYLCFFS